MDAKLKGRKMIDAHRFSAPYGSRRTAAAAIAAAMISVFVSGIGLANSSVGDAGLFERLDSDADGRITAGDVSDEYRRLFDRLLRRGDVNSDDALSRDEFSAALVPSRPEKTIETKGPDTLPETNAVRWLLLTMDTTGDGWIEATEVPNEMQRAFAALAERLDRNSNDILESFELIRGGRPLAQIAARYVRQNEVDVETQLRILQREQGAAARRFEERRGPLDTLSNPQRARQFFIQHDVNKDGRLDPREVPESLGRPIQRLRRTADRNRDGQLSEREFVDGARRLAARMARQSGGEAPSSGEMSNEAMRAEKP
jgi:hypothetical protein